MTTNDQLAELQAADLRLRCMAHDYFADINIIARDDQAPSDAEAMALGFMTPTGTEQKIGACLIIDQPIYRNERPGQQAGPMRIDWQATALENRLLNADTERGGTGKRALAIARHFAQIIGGYYAGGLTQSFVIERIDRIPAVFYDEASEKETSLVAWQVKFHCLEADAAAFLKVGPPIIAADPVLTGSVPAQFGVAGALVTITPAADASAYYTTDLSYPCDPAVNPAATLYTVPFIAPAGTLRVACAKSGYIDSNVLAVQFE